MSTPLVGALTSTPYPSVDRSRTSRWLSIVLPTMETFSGRALPVSTTNPLTFRSSGTDVELLKSATVSLPSTTVPSRTSTSFPPARYTPTPFRRAVTSCSVTLSLASTANPAVLLVAVTPRTSVVSLSKTSTPTSSLPSAETVEATSTVVELLTNTPSSALPSARWSSRVTGADPSFPHRTTPSVLLAVVWFRTVVASLRPTRIPAAPLSETFPLSATVTSTSAGRRSTVTSTRTET